MPVTRGTRRERAWRTKNTAGGTGTTVALSPPVAV